MSRLQIGVLIFLGTSFGILAYLASHYPYLPPDLEISHWMQSFDGYLLPLMRAVSLISSRIPAIIIVVVTAIWLGRSGRRLEAIITGAATGILSLAVVPAFKVLVDRPRPSPELVQVMTPVENASFPSGHTAYVLLFYGFLCYLLPRLTRNRAAVNTLRTLLATLIGLTAASRIYLGAHWFSDVAGSLTLGGLVLLSAIIIYCYCLPKFSRREEDAGATGS